MKRLVGLLFALLLILSPLGVRGANVPDATGITSQTAVLMDMETGQVLYGKDMKRRIYPASTTKVLTALVVLENSRPYELVTVKESALQDIRWDSSHIALTEGEQFTVDSGLYALMLPSANDAANALAEHVAGSLRAFAERLNAKAKEIGALDTHFTNAHGLHDPNHYTTAYDMALITRYAMQNDSFRTYFGAARFTMPPTNKNTERPFTNYQHQLVSNTLDYNPDVIGGKVGYTDEAKHTMTTVARRGERTLVCTVMNSPYRDDKFGDTEQLLEFGFTQFMPYSMPRENYSGFQAPVLEGEQVVGSVVFSAGCDFSALLHDSVDPESVSVTFQKPSLFTADTPMECYVTFEAKDSPAMVPAGLGTVSLAAEVQLSAVPALSQAVEEPIPIAQNKPLRMAVIGAGVLLMGMAALIAYRSHCIRRKRQARLDRLARRRQEAERRASYHHHPRPARTMQSNKTRIG